MRKIIVSEFMSVDGVIEDPGGSEGFERGGWAFQFDRGAEGDRFKFEETMNAGAMLLGRVTYEGFAAAWPGRTDDAGFADRMNSMPKYVVSNSLETADWENSTIVSGDVVEELRRLKQGEGGDLLVAGSATLVRTLIDNGLVDEYRLMIFPVVLGAGKRMFADTPAPAALEVVDSRTAGEVQILVLRPKPAETEAA
jgi:dihydrofolate reductase